MLINIRDPKEPASRYCFPSKIFEYMVSGNPVLSTVIEGIPREYFDYIIPLPDIDSATLREKIKDVAKMSAEERASYGEKARDYVLTRKNNVAQMKTVLDFISR
jgi:glycosyltransferase involved in cell wall biosynthesis